VIIILFSRLLASLVSKIGQPLVIGEIIAGILLGPSLLGLLWPGISNFLFPPDSLHNIEILSQLGLILFMFIIGLELDIHLLKDKAHTALVVSHASIILPFFGGVSLAYFLYQTLAPAHISFLGFGLFIGIAMSITAFPVLARIIQERGLTQSPLGVLAITSAAAGDVTAWCILPVVIAITQASTVINALFIILLSAIYAAVMLMAVRPLLQRLMGRFTGADELSRRSVVIAFVILFLSAFTTEVIGIHALFGAFLAGVVMPAEVEFRKTLAAKIEDVSLVILLPLFFASTGLRTQIGLLNDSSAWWICGLIILVAVIGKAGGSLMAARFTGHSWSESLSLGALMNTRGLMELIVLSIGYDLGVLSPKVYTMMVLMALVTTFMTAPALYWIERIRWKLESISARSLPERF
jgi:Kef-type K+ transport system membrane component KefB